MDSKSSPVPPEERLKIGVNMEESDGLQEEFIRKIFNDQTTNCTLTQRFSQLPIDSPALDGAQRLPNHQVSSRDHKQFLTSQTGRPT